MNKYSELTISREIDGAYVVWFAAGNQYLRLEEPAFFVFERVEGGMNQGLIDWQCAERYQIQEGESHQFVAEIIDRIEAIKKSPVIKESDYQENQEIHTKQFSSFSIHDYEINGILLRFKFETWLHEHYLHPLLQHLETKACITEPILFELFGQNDRIVLCVNHEVKGVWTEDETHLLKGMAFLQILNAAYKKNDHDWMAIIHASAVTNGTKTMVFTASPGSGKSTIAAMLQQKGYALVSDDFVPVEHSSKHVFPFPAAMSVKEGATELLSAWHPSLQSDIEPQRSLSNKLVRYLPVDGKAFPAPVKELIFIKYDPEVNFEMEKLPRIDALKMLLDETWTFPSSENAARFLDWYSQLSCYRLTYSNNGKALQNITELFDQ